MATARRGRPPPAVCTPWPAPPVTRILTSTRMSVSSPMGLAGPGTGFHDYGRGGGPPPPAGGAAHQPYRAGGPNPRPPSWGLAIPSRFLGGGLPHPLLRLVEIPPCTGEVPEGPAAIQ